ncbi:hypothetical protein ACB092_12G105500 [Castanea dentata]
MEVWFIIVISLCISALLKSLLFNKYGPIITIYIGFSPVIFVANHSLAHKALIQNSTVFADRPAPPPTAVIVSSNKHNINSASYGPTWRLLRRNLTSEILHPSRMKSYSHARKWVLDILLNPLRSKTNSVFQELCEEKGIRRQLTILSTPQQNEHFQYSMLYLLVLMCFGDKLGETQIKKIEEVQRCLLLSSRRFAILNFFPSIGRIFFRKRWEELFQLRRNQDDVLIPLIKARRKVKQERQSKMKEDKEIDDEFVCGVVDTLLDLELPEEKRKLEDKEMVNLCSEFLDAGTDTTSTALEWIMANMVKYPQIQERLLVEIKGVVGDGEKDLKEEDLNKIPYLKAVVLEGLRRHPPAHFVLPHAVTKDVVLDGYLVPKNAILNFMVAEMGWDSMVWEDPMEFKPERFLSGGDDEPFGAGRRICPASGLAILHLEYFVANLVLNFEWKVVDGDEVDLSEKHEFTMVMKNPLKAHLSPRL